MAVCRTLLNRYEMRSYSRKLRLLTSSFHIHHSNSPLKSSPKQQQNQQQQRRQPFHSQANGAAAGLGFNHEHARKLSTSAILAQLPQIQLDVAASPSYQPLFTNPKPPSDSSPNPDQNPYADPDPNPSAVIEPSGLSPLPHLHPILSQPHVEVAGLDAQSIAREMNSCLSRENPMGAAKIFEQWKGAASVGSDERNVPSRALYNLYLHSRSKLGASYQELCNVVKEMEEAAMPPDLTIYNFLLRALFREKDSSTAETVLAKMEQSETDAQPDGDSYNIVVVLCAFDKKFNAALKYFQAMIQKKFEPSKMTINEVISAASKQHQTRAAVELLKIIEDEDKIPMLTTCGDLLVAAADVDDAECASLALDLIHKRPTGKFTSSLIYDEGTLLAVLSTAARNGDAILADKVWDTVVKSSGNQQHPSPAFYHAHIHAHSAAGNLKTAFGVVGELESAYGAREDEINGQIFSPFSSLRPLVLACSRGGAESLDTVYYLLEEFHAKEQRTALASINCIILGCSNTWDVERAYQTFQSIESVFGLRPDLHSYNALISGLAKTKRTSEALKVYEHIKNLGMRPDSTMYVILVEAHLINRDTKSALDLLNEMVGAGQVPLQQSTLKVWRRCFQEGDKVGLMKIKELHKKLGYSATYGSENRGQLLFNLLKK